MNAVRIKSVTFKDSGLRVYPMPDPALRDRVWVMESVRKVLNTHLRIAGFAFIAWEPDGSSACVMDARDISHIPTTLIPDFVRERLRAERMFKWMDDAKGE